MIRDVPKSIDDGVVTLREVRPEDSRTLYEWRMHPESRSSFRSTEVVPYPTHEEFFRRYFADDNNDHWFVAETEGEAVASIAITKFSEAGRRAEWERMVVDPERRRGGIGRRTYRLLLAHSRRIGLETIDAEVLEDNVPVLRILDELGFERVRVEEAGDGRRYVYLVKRLEPA